MVSFAVVLQVRAGNLESLDDFVLKLRVLPKHASSRFILTLDLIGAPSFISDPRRVHRIVIFWQIRIALQFEVGQVLVIG